MYEIKPTLNIKAKLYSIWCEGVEIVRSLSKTKATTLLNHLNPKESTDDRQLQASSINFDDTIPNVNAKGYRNRRHRDASSNTPRNASQEQSNSVCDDSNQESYQPDDNRGLQSTNEPNDELRKEHLMSEFRQLSSEFKQFHRAEREFIGEQQKFIGEQQKIIGEQHESIGEQHETIGQFSSIALWALQRLSSKGITLKRRGYQQRDNNESNLRLDMFTVDVEATD